MLTWENSSNQYIWLYHKRRKNHHLLYENLMVLHLNKLEFPSSKDALCHILVEISPAVLEKKIFKFCQCIFVISLSSPLEKGWGPSLEQTWVLTTQWCIVQSLVEIGSVVLEKKIFFNSVNVFLLFRNYLPLERGGASF